MLVLRKLLDVRRADAKLPTEVRRALVDSLYGPVASLMAGAISGGIMGVLVSVTADNLWITLCCTSIFLCGVGRAALAVAYRRRSDRTSEASTLYWERAYAIGAWIYSSLLGLQCVLAFGLTEDTGVHLSVAVMSSCYAV